MPKSVCLLDAKNFLFRQHFTHSGLSGPDGEPTSVLYGCTSGLLSLAKRFPDTPIVFVWDGGGETWRHRLFRNDGDGPEEHIMPSKPAPANDWLGKQIARSISHIKNAGRPMAARKVRESVEKPQGYKAHRDVVASMETREQREIAISQVPEFKKMLRTIGIRNFRVQGLEGDDLIGILATYVLQERLFDRVIIESWDTDFYQMLDTPGIELFRNRAGEAMFVDREWVRTATGVTVDNWVKYRALTGDKSDNIPQLLRGVGPVRAQQLLRAGVDASLDCKMWPSSARNKLADMTKGQIDIETFGRKLNKNYRACGILRTWKSQELSRDVRERIVEIINAPLESDSFRRDPEGMTAQAYNDFCEWCSMHGMLELRAKSEDLRLLV